MVQLILVWARPLFALGRFYLYRAEVKRRFMRLQQRRLMPRSLTTSARIVADKAPHEPLLVEYRDAA
jgi:hypothetical protein